MAAAESPMVESSVNATADSWAFVARLPCQLSVEMPLTQFCFADLAALRRDVAINTNWTVGQDVPLRINGQLLAWCEFEVKEGKLAVRMTEFA